MLVNFWATWCPPCKKEIPDFIKLHEQYKDQQFTVLGIAVNEDPKKVEKFITEKKISYPIVPLTQEISSTLPLTPTLSHSGANLYPQFLKPAPDAEVVRLLGGEVVGKRDEPPNNLTTKPPPPRPVGTV